MPALTLAAWPLFGLHDDIRGPLGRLLDKGPAALVTIVALEGGGPRPVGGQMAFGAAEAAGFLSGGCIEADVALHAALTLEDGRPRRLVYGRGSPWPDIQLMCGARLDLLVERLLPGDPAVEALLAAMGARSAVYWTSDGIRRACLASPSVGDAETFTRRFDPPWRLMIFGADPTALAIASLGLSCGYEVMLVRHKGPFEAPPIAGLTYRRGSAAEAFAEWPPDPWTAVAVCNHDMDLDEATLIAALGSQAAYVGLLGARSRLQDRLARLGAAGLEPDQLARLRAPIGLKLGGKAPFEIATAVLGEMIAERHSIHGDGVGSGLTHIVA